MSLNIFTRNVQLFGVTVIKFLKALIQIFSVKLHTKCSCSNHHTELPFRQRE